MLRNGYFFEFEDFIWRAGKFPPNSILDEEPNSAFTFQGKLTVFGSPTCDSEGKCLNKEVIQYDYDSNTWVTLGEMDIDRTSHHVVEVPAEFCNSLTNVPGASTVVTTSSSGISTTEPMEDQSDNVAMVIGGVEESGDGTYSFQSLKVELFGCPDHESTSVEIQEFPYGVLLTSAQYYPHEDSVLVCGGIACTEEGSVGCPDGVINLTSDCQHITPRTHWRSYAPLPNPEYNGLLTSANLDGKPLFVYQHGSYLLDLDAEVWHEYGELEETAYGADGCMVQHGHGVYYISKASKQMIRLDTQRWEKGVVSPPLPQSVDVSRCSLVEIDGTTGKVT